MNGFCAGLVLTVGGIGSWAFLFANSHLFLLFYSQRWKVVFFYLFIILAFEFILTVSACFFFFNLGICFSSLFYPFVYLPNGGVFWICFFRHIGVFGFFFVCLFPFCFLIFYSGRVWFIFIGVGSALGVTTFDPFYYIYIFFEISFLSKPALYSSSCQDTGIGREEEEEEVRKQKKYCQTKGKKKKEKKRENHNVLLSYQKLFFFERGTCLWSRALEWLLLYLPPYRI